MGILRELSGEGRVLGGYLAGGTVHSGGSGFFSKHGDLSIEPESNPFKRYRLNADTVTEWEELATKESVADSIGRAAAKAAIPGRIGKAVEAGIGAAINSGHTIKVQWADGKQSIIELPEKQFTVFSTLLRNHQIASEIPARPREDSGVASPSIGSQIVDMALSTLSRSRHKEVPVADRPAQNVTEQIEKLATLHEQGILTDAEFTEKKADLLKRL